ncbi:hypothetical protein OAL04_03765 [Nitrospinae bacterium]|nr:hypothetical protein [Nitrospinota bacterium]
MIQISHFRFLLIIFFFCFFNSKAFADEKHKIVVTELKDPPKWNKKFSPGKILTIHLKNQLAQEKQVYLLPDKSISPPETSGSLLRNELNMMGSSASSSSLNNSRPNRFNYSKDGRFYDRIPNINDSIPSVKFISGENIMGILPIQDSTDNTIDKIPKQMPPKKTDPVPWPVRLGRIPQKASFYQIRGEVLKFDTGANVSSKSDSAFSKKQNSESAEIDAKIQLIQNKTGRVIEEKIFKSTSNAGRRPFSEEIDLHHDKWSKEETSSMNLALTLLSKNIVSYVNDRLQGFALEGDIISVKNKDVLINLGKQNGVEVGDKYRVFSLGLGLNDPLTDNDLGDIYVKMGVIQITDSMLGFSRAMTIVGKDFMPGNVVRSFEKSN